MTTSETKKALVVLCTQANALAEIAKTATRNGKSLRGDNYYGNKFHDGLTAMAGVVGKVRPVLIRLTDPDSVAAVEALTRACETLKSFDADGKTRMGAVKNIEHACQGTLNHALDGMDAPSIPVHEQVLPMAVVKKTRGYFEIMVLQANGCYERGWYDAASVMVRKFVELLIIEVYVQKSRAADIKNPRDGFFHMLSNLIEIFLKDAAFSLARETQATLPLVKAMGDRSAHARHYMATKADVDKIIPGLRILAEELLHLADLK